MSERRKRPGKADRRGRPDRPARRGGAGRTRDDLPRRVGEVLSPALDRLATSEQARAYAAWARAVGDPVAGGTRPKAFSRGCLTIECASSVWANELTYLGPQILRRMDELAPDHPVKRFRFVVGRLPATEEAEAGRELVDSSRSRDPSGPSGQDFEAPTAKKNSREEGPAAAGYGAASAQAEGVRDERLRAAIEGALRRSSEEPPTAPGRSTPKG